MRILKRAHETGTEAVLTPVSNAWRIQINLKEPNRSPVTIAFQRPTLELAQKFADKEVLAFGHVCNGSCKEWVEVMSAP